MYVDLTLNPRYDPFGGWIADEAALDFIDAYDGELLASYRARGSSLITPSVNNLLSNLMEDVRADYGVSRGARGSSREREVIDASPQVGSRLPAKGAQLNVTESNTLYLSLAEQGMRPRYSTLACRTRTVGAYCRMTLKRTSDTTSRRPMPALRIETGTPKLVTELLTGSPLSNAAKRNDWRVSGSKHTRGARSLQDAYRAAVHARNSGAVRAGDRCAEAGAPQNQIFQVDSLDLGGPRARRALREMGPRHPYRSAWTGGSAVLIRCCDRVVVATETPQFVVLVVDVTARSGDTLGERPDGGDSTREKEKAEVR